jgi:hypothetical protein
MLLDSFCWSGLYDSGRNWVVQDINGVIDVSQVYNIYIYIEWPILTPIDIKIMSLKVGFK